MTYTFDTIVYASFPSWKILLAPCVSWGKRALRRTSRPVSSRGLPLEPLRLLLTPCSGLKSTTPKSTITPTQKSVTRKLLSNHLFCIFVISFSFYLLLHNTRKGSQSLWSWLLRFQNLSTIPGYYESLTPRIYLHYQTDWVHSQTDGIRGSVTGLLNNWTASIQET